MTATFNGLESMLFAIEAERAELSAINAKLHDNHKKATRRVEVRHWQPPPCFLPKAPPKRQQWIIRARCLAVLPQRFVLILPRRAVPCLIVSFQVLCYIVSSCLVVSGRVVPTGRVPARGVVSYTAFVRSVASHRIASHRAVRHVVSS